jgi:Fic family protein
MPISKSAAYLKAKRDAYYEGLTAVSRDGDWTGWCRFFLEAIRKQAEENQRKAFEILNLYAELKPRIFESTGSKYAIHALDWLFARPIFRSTDFTENSGIPKATGKRILVVLNKKGILKEFDQGVGRRAAVFILPRLLNIAEGHEVF